MRKLLIFVLLSVASAFAGTCGNSYTYSYKFTVPASQVPNTDQANYPVTVAFNGSHFYNSFYLPDLKTVANGGKIQNTANNSISISGPADLIFCDAASAGNALKFEVSQYTATTGSMEAFVMIPTLSHTTSTSFWMFYGNVAVVTSQQDLTLWSTAGFSQVCHMPNGTSLNIQCSTGGTSTNVNTVTATAGVSGGGGNFVAASSQGINTGTAFNPTTAATVEAWANVTASGNNLAIADSTDANNGVFLREGAGGSSTVPFFGIANGGGTQIRSSSFTPATGEWVYVVGTLASSVVHTYANGVLADGAVAGATATNGASASNLNIGRTGTASTFYGGQIDEVRTSLTARSADWIATSYNDEYSPSVFANAGIPTPTPSGAYIRQYNSCKAASASTNPCAFSTNGVSGNLIIVVVNNGDAGNCSGVGINTLLTDSLGSTFSELVLSDNLAGGHPGSCIASATLASSGAETITASAASSSSQSMQIYEIAGVFSPSLDVTTTASGGASGTLSTGSATATTANSILICSFSGSSSGIQFWTSSISPSTGLLVNQNSAIVTAATKGGTSFIQFTGSGSKSCTFTFGGPGPSETAGALAVIKYSTSFVSHKLRPAIMY